MAVGMVPHEVFEEIIQDYTVEFTPSSTLTLYTDGITEVENQEHEEFGASRLIECLEASSSLTAAKLNSKILEKMEKFATDHSDRDDLTLLTVKRV